MNNPLVQPDPGLFIWTILTFLVLLALLALAVPAQAAGTMSQEIKALNDAWAHIAYEMKGSSTQTKALDQLAEQAAALVRKYPGQAEPLLWEGIVTSEQANRANIFHKLGLARQARDIIARAYAIDPKVANGGAGQGCPGVGRNPQTPACSHRYRL